jgi:imidazoleglycerol phosphate synthase glutamine amidotransferase subunit HisH
LLNELSNIHILRRNPTNRLQNNPSIGWVRPKFTHAHPLAWAIKTQNNFYFFISSCFVRNERKTSNIKNIISYVRNKISQLYANY